MIDLASRIRTRTSERLLNKTSLSPIKLHKNIIGLFVDRTSIDTTLRRFMKVDDDILKYPHCLCLNDEKTIKFHQGFKHDHYIYDEERGIWRDADINPITDDCFIPRDDS